MKSLLRIKYFRSLLLLFVFQIFKTVLFAQVATLPVFFSGSFGTPDWSKTNPNLAPVGFTWNSGTNANNLDAVGGPGASLNDASRFIQIHFNQSPNELSFMYRRQSSFGGTARIFESVDGINWGVAIWTMGSGGNMTNGLSVTLTLNPNSRYVRFDRTGSAGRLEIDAISITPAYRANVTMIDHGSSSWCVGETRPVTVRFQNTGSMTWFANGNTSGDCADPNKEVAVSYRWNGDPNWDVYNNRNPLPHDVPPGGTVDVTFPVQSPNGNPIGPNNLSVNLIVQECLWFNNASPIFTTGSIDISAPPTGVSAGVPVSICAGAALELSGSADPLLGINYFTDFNGCNSTTNPAACGDWQLSGGWGRSISNADLFQASSCNNASVKANVWSGDPVSTLVSTNSLGQSNGEPTTLSFIAKCTNYNAGTTPTPAGNCRFEAS
ncbi:MAG: hypothetical protein JJT77_14115 [Crocinitomicaceae bacterium]|nr:hypothetical protein [Crocinitomicaceae bacterium]